MAQDGVKVGCEGGNVIILVPTGLNNPPYWRLEMDLEQARYFANTVLRATEQLNTERQVM